MAILRTALTTALAVLWLSLSAGIAVSQDAEGVDYDAWQQTVERVDRVLDADRADETTLETLRTDVSAFRQRFLEAESANAARIKRVRDQLDALGPPPEEGSDLTEPPDVAQARADLKARLDELQSPGIRARTAYAEADGLITQIDTALRARQADRILHRSPLPINPLNWQGALNDLRDLALNLPTEIYGKLGSPEGRADILGNLPQAVLSLLAGAFMVFRTVYWTDRLASRINAIGSRRLRRGMRLLIAIAELTLPLIGLGLLIGAIQLTGLPGPTGSAVLIALYTFGSGLVVARWLLREFYPKQPGEVTPLRIDARYIPKARRMSYALAMLLSLELGLKVLAEQLDYSGQSAAFIGFGITVVMAYVVHRIARLFRKSAMHQTTEGGESQFSNGVLAIIAGVASLGCLAMVVAGFAGYVSLANNAVVNFGQMYLFFGFVALSQRALSGFWQILRYGDDADGEEGLVPTLIGVLLILLSVPVVALIWGARVTDLTEVWTRVREGFQVGGVTVSPSVIVSLVVVFAIGYALTQLVQGALRHTILPKTRLDQGARTAMVSGVGYIGVFTAAVVAITAAGIDLSNLAILASALAVGIGFGLQTIVSNFVSGIILLIERPVSEGDWIQVGDQMGYVRRISVRATRIETFDRTDVIVPNADLVSGIVTNWTRGNSVGRVIVPVSVELGTDTRKVERVLDEVANAHPLVMLSPKPEVLFMGFSDYAMKFEIRSILRDVNWVLTVRSEMNHEVVRRFAEEGIVIPFPQRDVRLKDFAHDGRAAIQATSSAIGRRSPQREAALDSDGGDGDGF